jgi:hypothetical protein
MTWLFSLTSFQFASMRVEGLDADGDAVEVGAWEHAGKPAQ